MKTEAEGRIRRIKAGKNRGTATGRMLIVVLLLSVLGEWRITRNRVFDLPGVDVLCGDWWVWITVSRMASGEAEISPLAESLRQQQRSRTSYNIVFDIVVLFLQDSMLWSGRFVKRSQSARYSRSADFDTTFERLSKSLTKIT
jgi:hypothetical protein